MIFTLLNLWGIFLQIGNGTISTNLPSSDPIIPYSLIGSIIIAIVLGSTLLLNVYTIRQNTKERKLRQRPWVSNRDSSFPSVEILSDYIIFHIVNDGSVPAYDVKYTSYLLDEPPNDDVFKTDGLVSIRKHDEEDGFFDLGPNEHSRLHIVINVQKYKDMINNNKGIFYFGYLVSYKDINGDTHSLESRQKFVDGMRSRLRSKHLPHPK